MLNLVVASFCFLMIFSRFSSLLHKYMLELFTSVSNDLLFDHGLLCDLFLELSNFILISSLNFFLFVPGHEVVWLLILFQTNIVIS